MNALGPLQQQILDVLADCHPPVARMLLDRRCTLGKSTAAISRALDALQISDRIEREERGREIYYRLAQTPASAAKPLPPVAPLAPAAAAHMPPPTPHASCKPKRGWGQTSDLILQQLQLRRHTIPSLCIAIGITRKPCQRHLDALAAEGLVAREGMHLWRISASKQQAATPAAHTQVADNSVSGEAVPAGTSSSEPPPTGARKAPPIPVAAVEPKLAFNEARAAIEADQRWQLRRLGEIHASADPRDDNGLDDLGAVIAGDRDALSAETCCALLQTDPERASAARRQMSPDDGIAILKAFEQIAPGALPSQSHGPAMLADAPLYATGALADHAIYALWSDGSLQIDAGDVNLTLTPEATNALIHYLDRVCAVDQSGASA